MAFTADASEVLLTLAEISVAFAGFSSIVATFQKRSGDDGTQFDHFRFWIMLEFSLASLLFSMLPFALYFAGLSGPPCGASRELPWWPSSWLTASALCSSAAERRLYSTPRSLFLAPS